jgi:acylphosphatase
MRAKHLLVRGRVQGVGYRYFALAAANRWGIRGYVRNLPGGEVEIHAEGGEEALRLFKDELLRGPRMSRVREIIEQDLPMGSYSEFSIRG